MKNKIFLYFFLIILVLIGFYLRIFGLSANYSFWIDEFSSGQAAAAIAQTGSPKTITGAFEARNLLNHYLMGASMKIFGINEFAARFPSVIWGTFMVLAAYFVFSKIFSRRVGLATAMLTVFSVIEITWSRQARSYALFQLAYLLSVYFFWDLLTRLKEKRITFFSFLLPFLFLVIALLSHLLAITIVIGVVVYLLLFVRKDIFEVFGNLSIKKKIFFGLLTIFFGYIIWQVGLGVIFKEIFLFQRFPLKIYNNFWYYHSFLWRQYSLISFLTLLGIIFSVMMREKRHFFLLTILIVHTFFVIFFLQWLDVRYLFPVFPLFFFAFLVYFLDQIAELQWPKLPTIQTIFLFLMVVFLVANGYKFNFRPRAFYSPNADMKEIPLVDYNLIYGKIKAEIAREGSSVVVIDTWVDKIAWYLGRDYPKAFWIRSMSEVGNDYLEYEGKIVDRSFRFQGIFSEEDLLKVINSNPKGFILIDGHEVPFVPKDALSYIEDNLKVEMKLDRFSLDPDPYDTWPAWLYSWGISDK